MGRSGREFDVVLFGASGFTGELTAKYLAANAPPDVTWAVAGRNAGKLGAVVEGLRHPAANLPGVIVADSADSESLLAMTRRCSAVATAVGPYLKYGAGLVAACVATGTHYADLTGEFPFMRQMIEEHHAEAEAKGVKIVHCCGFDCIPVDCAVMIATDNLPVPAVNVRALFTKCNGGASGGTLDSVKVMARWANAKQNKALAKDPYILAPQATDAQRVDQVNSLKKGVWLEPQFGFGTVSMPWIMTLVDNRLVRRSLVLRGQAASYDESMSVGLLMRMSWFALTHLPSMVGGGVPKPGEGPSASVQRDGGFGFEVVATGAGGEECRVAVDGMGDPGYCATAVMLAESALCLALDTPAAGAPRGGVLTPSVAMGVPLVKRLEQTGRFTFQRTALSVPARPVAHARL